MMVDVIILGMEKLSDKPFTFIQYDESPWSGIRIFVANHPLKNKG